MKLRNFLSWFASSVIAFIVMLLLINIVTSLFVDISMQRTLPLVIGSVYDYASPDAQNQTKTTFSNMCQGIAASLANRQTQDTSQVRQECLPEKQALLTDICSKLNTLPQDQQALYQVGCQALNDGTLKKSCEQKESVQIDQQITSLSAGCAEYNAQNITTRDFLVGPLASLLYQSINDSLLSGQNTTATADIAQSQHINANVLKYALSYVQGQEKEQYLVVKIISILLLFILWFVVSHDLSDYLRSVSRMFFSTGMLIFATWVISFILVIFFTPDTTALLHIVSGQGGATQPPMIQLVELLPVIVLDLTSTVVLIIAAASITVAFLLYLLRRYYIDTHPREEQPTVVAAPK